MANVKNAYARFYPVNKDLSQGHFISLYTQLSKQLWRSWCFFNNSDNCFEVVYPSKSLIDYDLYRHPEIIDNYHIWIRTGDYSGPEDFIGLKSKYYPTQFDRVDYRCNYWAGFNEEWNLATSCLYAADELRIQFNTPNSKFLEKLITNNRYLAIDVGLNSELTWSYNVKIIYMKCTQTIYTDDFTGTHLTADYYSSELNWATSEVWSLLLSDPTIKLKEEFLDRLYLYDEKGNNIKFDSTINKVSFVSKNQEVQCCRWLTNDNNWPEGRWDVKSTSDWKNCINPEFIAFQSWYKCQI